MAVLLPVNNLFYLLISAGTQLLASGGAPTAALGWNNISLLVSVRQLFLLCLCLHIIGCFYDRTVLFGILKMSSVGYRMGNTLLARLMKCKLWTLSIFHNLRDPHVMNCFFLKSINHHSQLSYILYGLCSLFSDQTVLR